jgi:protein involved in polysaccharide export with SLBB domain
MRGARLLVSMLTALALAGCMQHRQAYYVVDPATGQPVPVVQSYSQPAYASSYTQPTYAQQTYAQPNYAPGVADSYVQYVSPPQPSASAPPPKKKKEASGLYARSPAAAQQSYAPPQPAYAPPVYAQAAYAQPNYAQPAYAATPAPQIASNAPQERGLFSAFRRKRSQQAYAAAPQAMGGPYVAAPVGYGYAAINPAEPAYTLDSGDRLRVVVFGQDGISNSYFVGADGNVNLPLIGNVPARGFTTAQLAQMISERLKQGYVREPHVSVEVEAYRPFFILGEVTTPGQYPYVANMTAETAIAIAGGFSPRADKRKVQLSRNMPGQQIKGDVPMNYPLRPGDTIVVKERWF